jgi:hypothetical protein
LFGLKGKTVERLAADDSSRQLTRTKKTLLGSGELRMKKAKGLVAFVATKKE